MGSEPTEDAARTAARAATAGAGREENRLASGQVPPSAASTEEGRRLSEALSFDLITGALYHRGRLGWYSGLHRVTMFVNLFASSAAVAAIAKDRPNIAIAISLI